MSRRVVGLVVAVVLAVFGSAGLPVAALAAPPTAQPNKQPAAKSTPANAKAARDRAAALAHALATAGPKAQAAARVAAVARTRAGQAAKTAAQTQLAALAAAKASTSADARAASAAKVATRAKATAKAMARAGVKVTTKTQVRLVAQRAVKAAAAAKAAAKAARKAAARSAVRAKQAAVAASKAGADATAKAMTARRAWLAYVVLAAPRSVAAARAAATARSQASIAVQAATTAQAQVVGPAKKARKAQKQARKAAAVAAKAKVAEQKAWAKTSKATARLKAARRAAALATAKTARAKSALAQTATRVAAVATARARTTALAGSRASAVARAKTRAAAQAKAAAGPNSGWRPSDDVVFNNPKGSRAQQLAIISEINAAIDATPAGGEIRMAQYLFNINSVADKLIAAHRRGASVQILVDDGELRKPIMRVRKALGTDKRARSFVATCAHSCMSNGASTIHAKFYLFSVAGQARYVSMISSANPYTGNTFNSWNNSHTIVGNEKIYNSLSQYFTDMLADRNNPNYFRVTESGKYTVYLYPQAARLPRDVVLLNVLNHTSCRTKAKGYGSGGRTVIRVANWGWTGSRMDIAKRLWELHDSGCRVQVMINKGRISRPIVKQLLKPSAKYGQMPVYDAWYDGNLNDVAGLYLHHKMLTIDGQLDKRSVKITWTGSQNFTRLATTANNDIILRVIDPAVTEAYNRNFAYIRDRYTHRMITVPATTGRLKLTEN